MERLVVTGVLLLTVVGFLAANARTAYAVAEMEVALGWAFRLGGGLVALVAAVGLLGQWLRRADAVQLLPGVVVLLAGLAVAAASWPPVVALGAVGVALAAAGRGKPPPA